MSTLRDKPPLPIIFGCSGTDLLAGERSFFRYANPLGFILFKRNISNPAQLRQLISELRAAVGRADAPIFIDQEGGRVQRLGPPHWQKHPAARIFGRLFSVNPALAEEAIRLNAQNIAAELQTADIRINCAPCLDLLLPETHAAIGDRAYAGDPQTVIRLARAFGDTLMAHGVLPVLKHLPGQGRAPRDSHHELPVVNADHATLRAHDFAVFQALRDWPFGMTAHVLYPALDAEHPATLSRTIIQDVIRGEIGFHGILLSDDLAMQALKGRPEDIARAALAAGINVLLHCSGDIEPMLSIAGGLEPMEFETIRAVENALRRIPAQPKPPDPELAERLDLLLGLAAVAETTES